MYSAAMNPCVSCESRYNVDYKGLIRDDCCFRSEMGLTRAKTFGNLGGYGRKAVMSGEMVPIYRLTTITSSHFSSAVLRKTVTPK
jgi:hypothetical protein